MTKKTIISAVVLLSAGLAASAQGISQSVQVTNRYESDFADFKKPEPDFALPDTLYRFDYDFDYSVFETPYTGSYQFSPYNINMVPESVPSKVSRFYLKAGAGYTLHPVLDVVYTPLSRPKANLSIYNFGKGYYGRQFHDFDDRLGLHGTWMMPNSIFTYNAGYQGLFTGVHGGHSSEYHGAYAGVDFRSLNSSPTFLSYMLDLDYRFSSDYMPGVDMISEHYFAFGGSFGPVIATNYRFLLDFKFQMSALMLNGANPQTRLINMAGFYPHIKFTPGIFDIDAGIKADVLLQEKATFRFAPYASAGVDLLDGAMNLSANFKSGLDINDYWRLKSFHHMYFFSGSEPVVTRTRYDISLAVQGRIGPYFHYNIAGGYASVADAPVDVYQGLGFADYDQAYATAELEWHSESFDVSGLFEYRNTTINPAFTAYRPAAFTADFEFTYNYMRRIFASLYVDASTERQDLSGVLPFIPGYVDLGLGAEYKFSQKLSAWMRLGNLMASQIQRRPGFVEDGIYFTLGVKFVL